MSISRLGSAVLLNTTLKDVATLQEKLAEMQTQISSGYKSSDFRGLDGSVERYTLLESQLRRTEQYVQQNSIAKSRLQTADNAMGNMVEIATSLTTLMVQSRGTAGNTLNFEQQANDLLKAIGGQLNVTADGHYIFGGTNTSAPPVPDTSVRPVKTGVPDDNYYKGAKQNTIERVDDNTQFDFPVRADDPAFQKIFAAVHQSIAAFSNNDDAAMASALNLMQQGQDMLTASRAKVQSTLVNVSDTNTRLDSLKLYLQGLTEEVSKTDTVAVTTQIANYQAILQASFQVYARLSQLRLSDYLK
jgi:flagellar hook-associated protein 3 FlgL